jgi:Holliday junction resolvase RusA-like endonuclease
MIYQKQIIYGDIPSKSNGYKIVTINGHGQLAKHANLVAYENKFYLQCKLRGMNIGKMFKIDIDVFFGSNRKDLDGSFKIFFDCLQSCGAIKNDRQCAEIHARKLIDKVNPRVEFVIEEIDI